MKSAAENIKGVFIARVSILALSVFTAFFYARVLERLELAILAWVMILSGLEEMIGGLGTAGFLLRAYPQAMARDEEGLAASYIRTFLLISVGSTVALCVVAGLVSAPLFELLFDDASDPGIRYLALAGVLFAGLYRALSFVAQARTDFVPLSRILMAKQLFRSLAVIGLYFVFGAYGLVLGVLLAELGSFVALLRVVRGAVFRRSRTFPVIEMIRSSLGYYAEGYVRYVTMRSDTLLVSLFFGPNELAFYYMAKNLADKMIAFRDGISQVMVPYLARAAATSVGELARVVNRSLGAFSVTLAPPTLLLCVGSFWLLDLFSGDKYLASTPSTILLTLNLALAGYMAVFGQAIYVRGEQTERLRMLIVQSGGMLVGLALLYFVYPHYNVVAISRLCGTAPALFFAYHRLMGMGRFRLELGPTLVIVAASLAGALFAVGGQWLHYSLWSAPLWIAGSTLVAALVFANAGDPAQFDALLKGTPRPVVAGVALLYRLFRIRRTAPGGAS